MDLTSSPSKFPFAVKALPILLSRGSPLLILLCALGSSVPQEKTCGGSGELPVEEETGKAWAAKGSFYGPTQPCLLI